MKAETKALIASIIVVLILILFVFIICEYPMILLITVTLLFVSYLLCMLYYIFLNQFNQ